jgi:hypothetical protein
VISTPAPFASTREEWTSALRVASEFEFASTRRLAVRNLFPLASPIDRIVFGRRYDILEWLLDAYVAVVVRPEPITEGEGEVLGLRDVVHISALRRSVTHQSSPICIRRAVWSSCCPSVSDSACEEALRSERDLTTNPLIAARQDAKQKRAVLSTLQNEMKRAQSVLEEAAQLEARLAEEERDHARRESLQIKSGRKRTHLCSCGRR